MQIYTFFAKEEQNSTKQIIKSLIYNSERHTRPSRSGRRQRTSASQNRDFGAPAYDTSDLLHSTLPIRERQKLNVKNRHRQGLIFKKTLYKDQSYSTEVKHSKSLIRVWVNFDKKMVLIISTVFWDHFGRFLGVQNRKLCFGKR